MIFKPEKYRQNIKGKCSSCPSPIKATWESYKARGNFCSDCNSKVNLILLARASRRTMTESPSKSKKARAKMRYLKFMGTLRRRWNVKANDIKLSDRFYADWIKLAHRTK